MTKKETEKEIKTKIERQAEKLAAEHKIGDLRTMYGKIFGVATKSKDKKAIAEKLAKYLVTGEKVAPKEAKTEQGPEEADVDPDSESDAIRYEGALDEGESWPVVDDDEAQGGVEDDGQDDLGEGEETENRAVKILLRAKDAWDQVEALSEERKEKLRELRQGISEAKLKIDATLKTSNEPVEKRLEMLELLWRSMKRTEEKKMAMAKEYNDRIKDAKGEVTSQFSNIRQLTFDWKDK